jgi:hypothetical protein
MPREKAAALMLRKKGYSINQLSQFLGRSSSLIHQIVAFNQALGTVPRSDLRKLPGQTKKLSAQKFRFTMEKWVSAWLPFILGEVDRPP